MLDFANDFAIDSPDLNGYDAANANAGPGTRFHPDEGSVIPQGRLEAIAACSVGAGWPRQSGARP